jgi:hypothetical protein
VDCGLLFAAACCLVMSCTPTAPTNQAISEAAWQPVNCGAAEAGLEFGLTIWDFETAVGQFMYSYVDGTSSLSPSGYQPAAMMADSPRCTDKPKNYSFHMAGGPFLGWGGGMGIGLMHIAQDLGYCTQSPLPSFCRTPGAEVVVDFASLDLSQWEGVALWARREAHSQPLLRVLVGNKYTDDDISFLMDLEDPERKQPRYCERVRDCACLYQNRPCTYSADGPRVVPGGGYYCGAAGVEAGPAIMAPVGTGDNLGTNTCNVTRCNDPFPAYPDRNVDPSDGRGRDPAFQNRPCTPHTFRNGSHSSYCWDPDGDPGDPTANPPRPPRPPDPPPAEPDRQCGDHWTFPLTLSTEWQLFLVPFNTMFQQGWAQRVPFFDPTSVSVIRLTWEAGPIDYWIDDVRIYRRAAAP